MNENLLLHGNILLFAIIFLNVLLTMELLHFVLKVGWDYQYRKFEGNVICWHHHVVLCRRAFIVYMDMH